MAWGRYLTIVEAHGVSERLDEFVNTWPRFQEAWDALVWLLTRKAETLGVVDQRGSVTYRLYAQAGDIVAKTPRIVVVFYVEGDQVFVEGITASDPPVIGEV